MTFVNNSKYLIRPRDFVFCRLFKEGKPGKVYGNW